MFYNIADNGKRLKGYLNMKYLSVSEAAKLLNVSERTVRNYCAKGGIPGATLNGKTWLIPEDAEIKKETKEEIVTDSVKELVKFLDASPVNFYAIKNVGDILIKNGYKELLETEPFSLNKGDKFFVRRNGTTLLAFNIGKDLSLENYSYHIIASHCDSPCFKIKPEADSVTDGYNKINVEPYGGMLCSTWLDRPLAIAGRVLLKNEEGVKTTLINMENDYVMIPNKCIHFNRTANSGYEYNMASDMQPFFSFDSKESFKNLIASNLKVNEDVIKTFDLFLYNAEKAMLWGRKKEFISAPRLDDLECVFTSTKAFVESTNEQAINVLYISDNEEVGSSSSQGADGDFLDVILKRINNVLGFNEDNLRQAIANSFLVSADNAHAVHPNFPGLTDAQNKCYMNKGIAIKFNSSQRYTSDALSASIFETICEKANVPYQYFTNRSDVRGGSTLGNILLSHVSMLSVDIGLPQLAMHSSYETAGTKDINHAVRAFKEFYSRSIIRNGDSYSIK